MRRLPGENLRDDCVGETTQGGSGSVMVWTGICCGGKTPLVVPDGNFNLVVYQDILDNHYLLHARRDYGNNFRLQDDTALPHRTVAVREFLDAEGLQLFPVPAYYPYMNPIEHAWDAVGRAITSGMLWPLTASTSSLTAYRDVSTH